MEPLPSIAVNPEPRNVPHLRAVEVEARAFERVNFQTPAPAKPKQKHPKNAPPCPNIGPAAFYDRQACPTRNVLAPLLGKWPILLLTHLSFGPHRYTELRGAIPDISERMLTKSLRILEAEGIVLRTEKRGMPPHVDYRLTAKGESLLPILEPLLHWGLKHRAV